MSIKGKGVLLAVSALGVILAGAGPALGQGHSGGGGGGGHSSGGGGGHSSGGGGGGGHSFGGGHVSGGHVGGGGGHFAGPGHFAGGGHVAMGYHGGGAPGRGSGYVGGRTGYVGNHGYSTGWNGGWRGGAWNGGWRGGGWGGWRGGAWRGGYWNGGFWPRCYYGAGFAWFLPILPLAYATYWYGGVPYYYADDVYYTWNPTYDGYVVTDPPPVADASGSADVAAPAPGDAGAQTGQYPSGPIAGQIFMYPKNGQSAEQQASDKAECQRWASEQAGQVAQNGSDYNRAMVACVEGRGYSAR
jgi:hypothetical protein